MSIDKNAHGNLLPLSYSYEISSWIYKVLAISDSGYAEWLHNNGFSIEGKRFKFFTFSQLFFDDAKPVKGTDRLAIFGNKAQLYLSFLPEKSTEEFVKGIFINNTFTLGDRKSKVKFKIESIELLPPLDFRYDCIQFQTRSPIIVSMKNEKGQIVYISPEDTHYNYGDLLINNLKEKYKIYYQKEFEETSEYEFKLLSPAQSKLIRIKADTKEEIRIRGFNFEFMIKAAPSLLYLMYESGAGEKNSLGFGMAKMIK